MAHACKFFNSAEHSDVTLTLCSGRTMPAHKVFLVKCLYFDNCYRAAPGSRHWDLSESGIPDNGIIAILKYLYDFPYDIDTWTGSEVRKSTVRYHVSTYVAAEFFELPGLATQIIDNFHLVIANNANAVGFYDDLDKLFRNEYKDKKFADVVFDLVIKHADILVNSQPFITDAREGSPFLVRTLKHLAGESSSEIAPDAIAWPGSHDCVWDSDHAFDAHAGSETDPETEAQADATAGAWAVVSN